MPSIKSGEKCHRAALLLTPLEWLYSPFDDFTTILGIQTGEKFSFFLVPMKFIALLLFPVSLDNVATPVVCLLGGLLQQRFGPRSLVLLSWEEKAESGGRPNLVGLNEHFFVKHCRRA